MDFFEVIRNRFSVRAYQPRPVDDALLDKVLGAANDAPSAFNAQAYEMVVIRDAGKKEALAKACWNQMFVAQAPVVVAFFANPARNREKLGPESAGVYSHEDATIACAHAHLAATAVGLGSCWIAAYDQKTVNEVVETPGSWRSVALLAIGHPTETQAPRQRRPLHDVVYVESARQASAP